MPASHSKLKNVDARVVCGCAVLPLNGTRANACRGPAPTAGPDEQDIVDEALFLFRGNVFFAKMDAPLTGADRTLIYVTLFIHQCIKRCAREGATRDEGWKILFKHASSKMLLPGHADWPLPQYIFGEGSERDTLKSYFKQLRMGVIDELVHKLYDAETGEQNKWWMSFQGRKFMGMELLN